MSTTSGASRSTATTASSPSAVGPDGEGAVDRGSALAHARQAEPGARAGGVAARAVDHPQPHGLRGVVDGHRDRRVRRVPRGVGERLGEDPVERDRRRRTEPGGVAGGGHREVDARGGGRGEQLVDVVGTGLGRELGVVVVGAQDGEDPAQLGERRAGRRADGRELLRGRGVDPGQPVAGGLGADHDHRHRVGDDVVQVAGHPRAFLQHRAA
ncbi:hypothetical protein WCD41_28430 [Actinomycetospora sp. OC33-EN06]|uniref:Uncharacterized protein n=1 Tax=Actinomycetospora aeridis TaxID=3129231 RepID=A0ABU8NFL7_9PSEU